MLSEASAVFAESFQPQGIVQALADLLVPLMADCALVHVVDEHGDAGPRRACRRRDPASRERADGVLRDLPGRHLAGQPGGHGPAHRPSAAAAERRDRGDGRRGARRGAVRAPAHGAGGQQPVAAARPPAVAPLGLLAITRERPYGEDDLGHVLDLARRAALALDNASRYAFERDLAVTLQRSLLPRDLPMGPGYRAAARYLAGARGTAGRRRLVRRRRGR